MAQGACPTGKISPPGFHSCSSVLHRAAVIPDSSFIYLPEENIIFPIFFFIFFFFPSNISMPWVYLGVGAGRGHVVKQPGAGDSVSGGQKGSNLNLHDEL